MLTYSMRIRINYQVGNQITYKDFDLELIKYIGIVIVLSDQIVLT